MFKVGDKVRVIRPHWGAGLDKDEIYLVAIVVKDGDSSQGNESGLIVIRLSSQKYRYGGALYPYIWDFDRFEKIE